LHSLQGVNILFEKGILSESIKKIILYFNTVLRIIRSDYNREVDKTRNFDKIKKFFDMSEKNDYTLDNQTWDDLDMNKVYAN